MKIFLDETVARIQLVLANEYIWWQIFIFRRLVWLKWEHIYSILHYSSPALEIKDAKFQLRPEKWYKVDYLITDRCKDWLQNGIYVPIFKLYQFSRVKDFWLFAFVFSNGIQLMSLSVPIYFWNLLFEMLTMAKDRFPNVLFCLPFSVSFAVLFCFSDSLVVENIYSNKLNIYFVQW